MPRICGTVARKPKLTPELATRMLFGPGVKPIEARKGTLVSINAVGKPCISLLILPREEVPGARENGGVHADSAIPARAFSLGTADRPRSNCIGASIRWTRSRAWR